MTGISAYGAYVPYTRLPLALIAGRKAKHGGPEKAVAGHDEDTVTLAVAAALDCLTGIDRAQVDGVYFASTTYPLAEKQGAALIAKALDLRRNVRTTDFSGSLRAGIGALEAAANAVTAGTLRNVLVIASDCRMGAPRGPLEGKLGDGAAAFLISDANPIATFEDSFAVSNELQDLWRRDGETFTHTWEDRFAIQEGYTPNLVEAVRGLLEKSGAESADFARAALYAPDARSLGGVARKLGLGPEQLQDAFFGRLGNTGTAFAPMLLAAALETAKPGERLLVAGYGDGAHALSFQVTEFIEKLEPRRGVTGSLERRRALASYDTFLRARQLDPKEWQAGADLGLSATIRFRERDADIALVGARCRSCNQIHFPQPRVCYKCHTKDEWEPHRLSDKTGSVLAYTFDYFFPASEPPTTVVMVEVEGCRVQVQLADARPEDVRLDLPVAFAFRKIHEAGGKPNYFWKAVRLEEASS
jgi:3-hydroxy-3-methylglutaryl CoA synthase/uncharacterized OB-fold protein